MLKLSVPAKMFIGFLLSGALTVAFCLADNFLEAQLWVWLKRIAIAFLLQFIAMYISGPLVYCFFDKRINPDSFWFKEKEFEKNLYKKLRVRHWKRFAFSYDKRQFSLNSPEKTVINMCHNELVHEFSASLSLFTIVFMFFGGNAVFWCLSSVMFAFVHIAFLIIQRYNRPRVLKTLQHYKK